MKIVLGFWVFVIQSFNILYIERSEINLAWFQQVHTPSAPLIQVILVECKPGEAAGASKEKSSGLMIAKLGQTAQPLFGRN